LSEYYIACPFGLSEDWSKKFPIFHDRGLYLCTYGENIQNIKLPYQEIADKIRRKCNEKELDLLEIASFIYLADIGCRRGHALDWVRKINFLIPVRDLNFWQDYKDLLIEIVSFLTGDNINFEFVKFESHEKNIINTKYIPRKFRDHKKRKRPQGNCVALLSGGIDSFAGAVKLINENTRPVFFRHYTNEHKSSERIVDLLNNKYSFEDNLDYIYFSVRPLRNQPHEKRKQYTKPEHKEPSQRTRSLLYLALASIIANSINVNKIFINENGLLAIHLPIAPARIGSFSTLTAHPIFLKKFSDLIGELFGKHFEIDNICLYYTKKELVDYLCDNSFKNEIKNTISCMIIGRMGGKHCGTCIPCLYRRFAIETSREVNIPDTTYNKDVFHQFTTLNDKQRSDMIDMIRFVDDFFRSEENELIYSYRKISESQIVGVLPFKVVELHKRFSEEVIGIIENKYPDLGYLINNEFQKKYGKDIGGLQLLKFFEEEAARKGLKITPRGKLKFIRIFKKDRWKTQQDFYKEEKEISDFEKEAQELYKTAIELAKKEKRDSVDSSHIEQAEKKVIIPFG